MNERDPRVVRTHGAVLRAAADLLLSEGWDHVTHARVARAAGFSRATVYNHWPSRTDLLRAAFEHIGAVEHTPSTGDLRADLVAELDLYRRVLIDK
ncbi:MAG: helix-turn-helix domain-containing protein, partial [Myxococcota bacterium]